MEQLLQVEAIPEEPAYGYDASMALRLARIVADCAPDNGILDFDDLMGNPYSNQNRVPLDLMMRPDLGIEFVRRIENPKLLTILSDPALQWLKVAASMKGAAVPNNWKQPSHAQRDAVAWAVALASDPDSRAHAELVNAFLLCGCATLGKVADLLKIDADSLAAYHDLFFNVLSRRSERAYVHLIAYPGKGTCLPVGISKQDTVRPLLALALRCQNLPMLSQYLSWENAEDTSGSLREASRRTLQMLFNDFPAMMYSTSSDPKHASKLLFAAIQAARSTLGQETLDDAMAYGDDDFSKFAERYLDEDVEALQDEMRKKMKEQSQIHE